MSIGNSYAKALFETAQDEKVSPEQMVRLENQFDMLLLILDSSKEARVALLGPIATVKEKSAIIDDFAKKLDFSPLFVKFISLLAKKGRLPFLREVRDAFTSVRLTADGGVSGQLVAAESMSETDVGTLAKAFSHKLGKTVTFQVSTDPSLLAGMKVTVNGVTYDGTLRSQLQKLRDRLVTGMTGANA